MFKCLKKSKIYLKSSFMEIFFVYMGVIKLQKIHKQKKKKLLRKIKSELVFETEDYKIEKIPLNYKITIKCAKKESSERRKIDRNWYSDLEFGIEEAKNLAKYVINEFFRAGVKPLKVASLTK